MRHVAKKNLFKAIFSKKTKDDIKSSSVSQEGGATLDQRRRLFLKAIGIIGLSAFGVSIFPKKSSALVMGGTPATSILGVKDSANLRINPAKEDGNLATIAGKDFATQTTLSDLKINSDKFKFDGDNLKVTSTGSSGGSSFSDSGDVSRLALVSADRHVQVDVLNSALPTLASTETTLQTLSFGGFKFALRMTTIGNFDYIGEAAMGAASSAAVWRIKRIDNTSGIIITWAGTGTFDQVWDNVAALSYS